MAAIEIADDVREYNRAVCDAALAQANHGWDGQVVPEDPTDYEVIVDPDYEDQSWWNDLNEEDALSLLWDQPLFALGRDRESLDWEEQELAEAGITNHPAFYPKW